MLLHNNADVNKARNDGVTALFIAAQQGHKDVVQVLLDTNAGVNKARNDGVTALQVSCDQDHSHPTLRCDASANRYGYLVRCPRKDGGRQDDHN